MNSAHCQERERVVCKQISGSWHDAIAEQWRRKAAVNAKHAFVGWHCFNIAFQCPTLTSELWQYRSRFSCAFLFQYNTLHVFRRGESQFVVWPKNNARSHVYTVTRESRLNGKCDGSFQYFLHKHRDELSYQPSLCTLKETCHSFSSVKAQHMFKNKIYKNHWINIHFVQLSNSNTKHFQLFVNNERIIKSCPAVACPDSDTYLLLLWRLLYIFLSEVWWINILLQLFRFLIKKWHKKWHFCS